MPDGAAATKLDLTTGMTIEAWVNPSSMSGWESVVYKERGAAGTGLLSYALYAHDGAPTRRGGTIGPAGYIRIGATGSADSQAPAARAAAERVDAHRGDLQTGLAGQRALRQRRAWSRTRAQRGNHGMWPATTPLRIGNSNAQISEGFNGMIDEVRIYNRALSAAEIATDMNTPIVQ